MAEVLDQESLQGLDVLGLGDLTVFTETVLNASADNSHQTHGAPDCSAYIPELAAKVAQALDGKLSMVKPPDQQRRFSDESFRMVNSMIYHFLEDKHIVKHAEFSGMSHMTNVWAGDVLRELVQHPKVEAL